MGRLNSVGADEVRIKCLVNDPMGRFKIGDEAVLLVHTSTKYDYFVDFGDVEIDPSTEWGAICIDRGIDKVARKFYFYAHEIKFIPY